MHHGGENTKDWIGICGQSVIWIFSTQFWSFENCAIDANFGSRDIGDVPSLLFTSPSIAWWLLWFLFSICESGLLIQWNWGSKAHTLKSGQCVSDRIFSPLLFGSLGSCSKSAHFVQFLSTDLSPTGYFYSVLAVRERSAGSILLKSGTGLKVMTFFSSTCPPTFVSLFFFYREPVSRFTEDSIYEVAPPQVDEDSCKELQIHVTTGEGQVRPLRRDDVLMYREYVRNRYMWGAATPNRPKPRATTQSLIFVSGYGPQHLFSSLC